MKAQRWAAGLLVLAALAVLCAHLRPVTNETSLVMCLSAPPSSLRPLPTLLASGTLDVNTATSEELQTLPGIGEVMAERILDERTANGAFIFPEDLLTVHGIGLKTLQKLLPFITLGERRNP